MLANLKGLKTVASWPVLLDVAAIRYRPNTCLVR